MPYAKSNYRKLHQYDIIDGVISSSAIAAAAIQASHGKIGDMVASHIVRMRQSWQLDSLTGDCITISMDGFGVPSWCRIIQLSGQGATIFQAVRYCVDQSTSLVYISLWAMPMTYTNVGSYSLGSLGATATVVGDVIALIASR